MESNFGVANVFCSIHQNIAGHMNTSKECDWSKPSVVLLSVQTRPVIFATPKFDSTPLQYSTPILRSIEYTVPNEMKANKLQKTYIMTSSTVYSMEWSPGVEC